jgi:hypothetical protein
MRSVSNAVRCLLDVVEIFYILFYKIPVYVFEPPREVILDGDCAHFGYIIDFFRQLEKMFG